MKLLICEEALIDFKGHFYNWIKAIRGLNIQRGVKVFIGANKRVDKDICQNLDCIPAYTYNSWAGIYDFPNPVKRYFYVFVHNYRVFTETRKLLKVTGNVDCILLPAARIHHLLAWKLLASMYLGTRFKRLIIFILTSEAIYDEEFSQFRFKSSSSFIKLILKSFRKSVKKGDVILAGDSEITCYEYEKLSGTAFVVFPTPAVSFGGVVHDNEETYAQDNLTRFVFLGVSVIDKGIDLLQQAIEDILERIPDFNGHFIIQWATPTIDYEGIQVPISKKLRSSDKVTLIEKVLNEEEYKEQLSRAHFLLLPYRRKVYYNRISGVAVEAACCGIPMIVTENTWLDRSVKTYGVGLTVKDGDPKDLAAKIESAAADASSLLRQAKERAKIAISINSSSRYFDLMWAK